MKSPPIPSFVKYYPRDLLTSLKEYSNDSLEKKFIFCNIGINSQINYFLI